MALPFSILYPTFDLPAPGSCLHHSTHCRPFSESPLYTLNLQALVYRSPLVTCLSPPLARLGPHVCCTHLILHAQKRFATEKHTRQRYFILESTSAERWGAPISALTTGGEFGGSESTRWEPAGPLEDEGCGFISSCPIPDHSTSEMLSWMMRQESWQARHWSAPPQGFSTRGTL